MYSGKNYVIILLVTGQFFAKRTSIRGNANQKRNMMHIVGNSLELFLPFPVFFTK